MKKILILAALFVTIFFTSSASASKLALSDMEFATFTAELQKNLIDKSLQINDLKRTPEDDIKPDAKNKIQTYSWKASLFSKESSAEVADVNFATDSDNKITFIALSIKEGVNQETICNTFWDSAFTALNFTADERKQFLTGGTINKDGFYGSKLQRSKKENFVFMTGILPNKVLFSTFGKI